MESRCRITDSGTIIFSSGAVESNYLRARNNWKFGAQLPAWFGGGGGP